MAKLKSLISSPGRMAYSEGLKIWKQAKDVSRLDEEIALMDRAYQYFRTSAVKYQYFAGCRSMVLISFDIEPYLTDDFINHDPIGNHIFLLVEYLQKSFAGASRHTMLPQYHSSYFKRMNSTELDSFACFLLFLDLTTDFNDFCSVKSSCLLQDDYLPMVRQNFEISQLLLEYSVRFNDPYAVLLATAFHLYHELNGGEKMKNILLSNANTHQNPEILRAAALLCFRDYITLDGVSGSKAECIRNQNLAVKYMMEYLRVLRLFDFPVLEPFAKHLKSFPKVVLPFNNINDANGKFYRGFAEFLLSVDCKSTTLGIMRHPFLIKPVFCFAESEFQFDRLYYATFWMSQALGHGDKFAIEHAEDALVRQVIPSVRTSLLNRVV